MMLLEVENKKIEFDKIGELPDKLEDNNINIKSDIDSNMSIILTITSSSYYNTLDNQLLFNVIRFGNIQISTKMITPLTHKFIFSGKLSNLVLITQHLLDKLSNLKHIFIYENAIKFDLEIYNGLLTGRGTSYSLDLSESPTLNYLKYINRIEATGDVYRILSSRFSRYGKDAYCNAFKKVYNMSIDDAISRFSSKIVIKSKLEKIVEKYEELLYDRP